MSVLTYTVNDPCYAMHLKHPVLGLLVLIHIYAMQINKIISITDYAKSVGARRCDIITNGPKGNWLSFVGAEGKQVSSLPVGGKSQDCREPLSFSILCFEDGGQVATANNYIVGGSCTFD